jgi:DNA-binding MarR family transcriptional regulator
MSEPRPSGDTGHLGELLTKASWRLRRAGKKELSALGLTFGQARALRIIVRARQPLRMGDLAAQLEIVPRSATTMVDMLEAAGLVVRTADPGDRRSVLLRPTAEGKTVVERQQLARRESAMKMFSALSQDERRQLELLLGKLCDQDQEAL